MKLFSLKTVHMAILAAAVLSAALAGCAIDDKYLCGDGLKYEESTQTCINAAEDTDTDTETETEDDGDGGAEIETEDGGAEIDGLGESCASDGDCEEYEAAMCGLNPLEPGEPGYCTLQDCSPGECPSEYKCCDCTNVQYVIACATNEDAEMLELYCLACN